jgi:secretion/DNA translocation related TadE-like protein
VLMFVMVGLGAVGGLVVAQRRVQSAADLSALAGATTTGDACAEAGRVAAANETALDQCRLDGEEVSVRVSVPGPELPWASRWSQVRVTAEARAGPG